MFVLGVEDGGLTAWVTMKVCCVQWFAHFWEWSSGDHQLE